MLNLGAWSKAWLVLNLCILLSLCITAIISVHYTAISMQRFCLLNKVWVEAFDSLFQEQVICCVYCIICVLYCVLYYVL